jgi:hypothetical protein
MRGIELRRDARQRRFRERKRRRKQLGVQRDRFERRLGDKLGRVDLGGRFLERRREQWVQRWFERIRRERFERLEFERKQHEQRRLRRLER